MSVYSDILDRYESEGRLRRIPGGDAAAGLLDCSTNDYLGLAARADIADEFLRLVPERRFTSGASRLLASVQQPYRELEEYLGSLYGKSVLLFNSGYHANTGAVSALGSAPHTVIVADKLVHASIIDGITLGKAPYVRFRHNDAASLRRLLEKHDGGSDRMIVVVESIYSMDGDVAPLREIAALKRDFPKMLLYVDEAHAIGVRGCRGLGVTEELGLEADVDILVGTFGKACASAGAFVAGSAEIRDFLVNSARSFIFSTALPPVNVAFTRFIFEKITSMTAERAHLDSISAIFRSGVERITGQKNVSESQIVPLMAGCNARAVAISSELRRRGVLALPIRRPTVPPGTERLRFSLNAGMTETDVDMILTLLKEAI